MRPKAEVKLDSVGWSAGFLTEGGCINIHKQWARFAGPDAAENEREARAWASRNNAEREPVKESEWRKPVAGGNTIDGPEGVRITCTQMGAGFAHFPAPALATSLLAVLREHAGRMTP